MYLKSLVLKGFKSFADRSVMNLEPGITAIVGPNGSGKSNISDAVLWVLGERNAKNLRGQVMEDVIFAGSSARKSVGVAEVDLVLDNSDGFLPVDYNEVVISRRMYRNGESDYLINGTVARRMDVLDILHDSGLGTGTHSIISQGNLDSILQSKPEDRRALIEEAAGVLKHKQRKAKSERRLEQMDQHLTRVHDVIGEVERQLGPLERKAKRARAYQGLSVELADLNLSLAVDDLRQLKKQWADLEQRESALATTLEQRRETIADAEKKADALQAQIAQGNADAQDIMRVHHRASALNERIDSLSTLLIEKRRGAAARVGELQAGIVDGVQRRETAQDELKAAQNQLEEAQRRKTEAEAKIAELEKQHAEAMTRRAELDGQLNEKMRARRDLEQQLDAAKRNLNRLTEELNANISRVRLVDARAEDLDNRAQNAKTDLAQAVTLLEEAQDTLKKAAATDGQTEQALTQARTEASEAQEALQAVQVELRSLEARLAALEEVERTAALNAGEKRAWVGAQERYASHLESLTKILRADPSVETFVERLLGSDIDALYAEDPSVVRELGQALRKQKLDGELVLLLGGDAHAAKAQAARAYAQAIKGTALIDHIRAEGDAQQAVEALLGDVVICDDIDQALNAYASDTEGLRFVSRDGCIVWPQGTVSIGVAIEDSGEGALSRARQINEMQSRLERVHKDMAQAEERSQAAQATQVAAQESRLQAAQDLAQAQGRTQAAQQAQQLAQSKLDAVLAEKQQISRQQAEASEAVTSKRPQVEELTAQVAQLEQDHTAAREHIAALQEDVLPAREAEQALSGQLQEARLSQATVTERENYARRMMEARQRDLALLAQSDANAHRQMAVKQGVDGLIAPLLADLEELTRSIQKRIFILEEQTAAAQESATGMHEAVTAAREGTKAAQEAFDSTLESLNELRVEKGRMELQVEAAVHVITDDCKTPLDKAELLPVVEDRAELEESVFKLRRRIANMGTINPDAAEEYEQLKVRYDYLAGQLEDLRTARQALAKINRVIDARMKEDFARTFEEVNQNFQEIFAILFPGGHAHLSLVDPQDIENTGVEVEAQPRGKRVTKMMLLSGGEKSLVALALLFAVYRIRTTPFYILDEVEAALDDTNLRRLTTYLDTLRDSTQFIMITHQRRTMEMADVLFGVSMQADGVTKVISQKLDRALQFAE